MAAQTLDAKQFESLAAFGQNIAGIKIFKVGQ